MTLSTARIYQGIITARSDPDIKRGNDTDFVYSAVAVNTLDSVSVSDEPPYRRTIYSELATRPQIVPADIGDPCLLFVKNGAVKLIALTEQYIVTDCAPTIPE
jgi:hypothetical protein